jgi:predicted N-acetyltransferase YhbS
MSSKNNYSVAVEENSEELRGQGIGSRLLKLGEEVALKRGCKIAVLFTFSFQAREFYEKQGYKVFGQLDGYPAGYSSYWLSKELNSSNSKSTSE